MSTSDPRPRGTQSPEKGGPAPYRHESPPERARPRRLASLDHDLWPVFAVLWLVSVGRVYVAFARRETFGVEATLAFLAVLLLPRLIWRALPSRRAKTHGDGPSDRPRSRPDQPGAD